MKKIYIILLTLIFLLPLQGNAQKKRNKQNKTKTEKVSLNAFKLRNVGPAFLSGRISDIAIHPEDESTWYVTAASGGVWKTENAGNTWNPIFDKQTSYSIGCVAIDPSNNSTIWIGTGENVGGRHMGYGDGIYKSSDAGKTWKNMGLKSSEHISEIIVHPSDSDVIWVAVQGPLWSKGGERGLYKTSDGGNNWRKVLGGSEWTGVTDIMIDPRNPNLIYAATWDRHRTVAAYMGGGPGSGIHKSNDGGETWKKLTNGIPKSNLGKIGIAISPQKPDVIYAAIEQDRTKGGLYKSEDRGESWKKMSDTVSGGTGPHYYQELYTSPHKFDRLYLMNVQILTSENGGKTFRTLEGGRQKHSDHHAIAFKGSDPDYIMVGTDAGVYESFDLAQNWHYFLNLPLTQFYKVAVNNAEPFYHMFGGTQDNGSAGGPSATDEGTGITNKDWYKTLFADGHQSATDPVYNNIIYATTQEGRFHRVDLETGEPKFIQPQALEGDPHERYNWDTPILVSPHNPEKIYIASYRVWESENRGDSWTPISGDLTRNENRVELPIMGRTQSWDNAWDVKAMSQYNTITSLSESPVQEGIIWAGTDDGYIQVTSNGGNSWKSIPVTNLGIPERSFVNDIKADLFDANTVYVSLDNHKEGDFSPYLFKSTDMGDTWKSISSNIPERTLIWRLVQDYINKDLLFVASEFGIYTSLNGGVNWQKLPGSPTIPFRDLVIQKRENDLVGASFGRGFYVLDDYSALRDMNKENLSAKGKLFKPRDAKLFRPRNSLGNTGGQFYVAKNPTYGAVFTYHLNSVPKTSKSLRVQSEKKLNSENKNIPFPGYEALRNEMNEKSPSLILTIKDSEGNHIRNVKKNASNGSGRIAWNLRHESYFPVRAGSSGPRWGYFNPSGPYVTPGEYHAELYIENNGVIEKLDGPVAFNVKPLRKHTLSGSSHDDYNSFRKRVSSLYIDMSRYQDEFEMMKTKVQILDKASLQLSTFSPDIINKISEFKNKYNKFESEIDGNPAKAEIGEWDKVTLSTRVQIAMQGLSTSYGPTDLNSSNLEIAEKLFEELKVNIQNLKSELDSLEKEVKELNPPHLSGSGIN
jgi:photosystem II stability/assembly factor-like uncharacterized protein|tara:strand:+ start:35 stop:3298 length:3264 start_codon:yes stop_codon:yes gene_type:complete